MRVGLVLGTEIDVCTPTEAREIMREEGASILDGMARQYPRPNRKVLIDSRTGASATATVVLNLGSPGAGSEWHLSSILVTGVTDREAPASAVAAVYCGPPARQLTATTITDTPTLGTLLRPAVAIPSTFTFPSHEPEVVKEGEDLTVIVYSLTTAVTTLTAIARVSEYPTGRVTANRI